jgi:transposase
MPRDETGKLRQTTLLERIRVIERRARGYSYGRIAQELSMTKSCVYRIVKAWEEEERVHPKPQPGRPRKSVTPKLIEACEQNPVATLAEVSARLPQAIHPKTAGRKLRNSGYRSFKMGVVEQLTDRNKARRLQWCKERLTWRLEEWRKKVFADETRVTNSCSDSGVGKVRRKRGQYSADYEWIVRHSGRLGAQFYAAIAYGRHTPLIHIPFRAPEERTRANDRGGMDARHYIRTVLEASLAPWWRTLPDEGRDYELVQDGNPAHRSRESNARRAELGIKTVCPHQFCPHPINCELDAPSTKLSRPQPH